MKIDTTQASKIPYGPGYYRRIAEFLASQVPGTVIDEAKTTESVYIFFPRAAEKLRISGHQSYGSNLPTHIVPRTKKGLPAQLDRACSAAIAGAHRYQDVPTWEAINA